MLDKPVSADAEKQLEAAREKVADQLEEVASYLRMEARTDYFTGYSLAETLQERVKQIGTYDAPDGTAEPAYMLQVNPNRNPNPRSLTKLGRLAQFEARVLAIIADARKLS